MRLYDWHDWLNSFRRRIRWHRHRQRNRFARTRLLAAELLEARTLPSSVTFTGDVSSPGVLLINLSDTSTPSSVAIGSRVVTMASGTSVEVVHVWINGSTTKIRQEVTQSILANLPTQRIGRIFVRGDGHANMIDLTGVTSGFGLPQAVAVGGQLAMPVTDEEIRNLAVASGFGAFVQSFGGNDSVFGSPFNDCIDAGTESDSVSAGDGNDFIQVDDGDDTVHGGAGADSINGGAGADLLIGSLGADQIHGDAGKDVIVGGSGRDLLDGGDGDDLLVGGMLNFASGQSLGLQDVRNRWLGATAHNEALRQSIAPLVTTVLGVDDNRDGLLDRTNGGKPLAVSASSTRLVVPQSIAVAFDPVHYGSDLPSGNSFLVRLENESLRIVSREVTSDPLTDVLIVARVTGQATTHAAGLSLVTQAVASESPLRPTALWTEPPTSNLEETVFDDFVVNTLAGGSGSDWFFTSDELLVYGDTHGDPKLNADDVLTDIAAEDARYQAVNAVPDTRRLSVPDDSSAVPPLSSQVTAVHGSITRLSGDPGTDVLTASQLGGPGDEPRVWGGVARPAYVTNPSYNVSSDLIHLGSFPAINGGPNELGQTRWDYLLDTHQLDDPNATVTPITPDIPSWNWRWSQNPAEPNVEYGFVSGVGPNGQLSGVRKYRYTTSSAADNDSGLQQLYPHDSQTLVFTSFDPWQVGGWIFLSKSTLVFNPDNGHNYMRLAGHPRLPGSGLNFDRSVLNAYVVDLDVAALPNTPDNAGQWADPVVASFRLTAPVGTPGFPYGSQPSNIDDFYFAPDGRHIMVTYLQDSSIGNGLAWRLLDVDLARGQIAPHVIPVTPTPTEDRPELRQETARMNGFFPFRWHHAVFAAGASDKVYVVGQPGKWSKDQLVSPNIQYLAGGNTIGQVLRFNPSTDIYASLTNPAFENITASRETLSHITATNTQNPGYVFASYYSGSDPFTASSPAYKGAIVAINIEQPAGPDGAVVLAQHRTSGGDYYLVQPMLNAASDGSHVLFQSTWGEYQQTVSTYDINLGHRVEILASVPAVLRRTGTSSVALFASTDATTPIDGTARTISAFDTLVVGTQPGQSLQLSVDFSAGSPVPTGGVLEIEGSSTAADQWQLKNAGGAGPWNWFVTGDGSGQLRGTSTRLIRFHGVESLTGSEGVDEFHIGPAARWRLLSGGTGNDLLNFASLTSDVSAWLFGGTASFASLDPSGVATSFAGQISQFENLTGGVGNDFLRGDDGANSVQGGGGNDTLVGGAGNDSLFGGAGNDMLNDVAGTNTFDGGADNDSVYYVGTWSLSSTNLLASCVGIETVFGAGSADVLSGSAGGKRFTVSATGVTIAGVSGLTFTGVETLVGGTGHDTFQLLPGASFGRIDGGGGLRDLLDYSAFSTSVSVNLGTYVATGVRSVINVDGVRVGSENDSLVGSSYGDILDGGDGNDTLDGQAGDDTLIGGDGNDTLTANGGNDSLDGGTGDDTLIGGAGADTLLGGSGSDLLDDSPTGNTIGGGAETDVFHIAGTWQLALSLPVNTTGIETVFGVGAADSLAGTVGNDVFQLGSPGVVTANGLTFQGFEVISGRGGNDTFQVFDGAAFSGALDGGGGADVLDFSASTINRSVTLTASSTLGFSGREQALNAVFRAIETARGGTGSDTLMGLGVAAIWDVGKKQYKDTSTTVVKLFNWGSFENLVGGLRRDTFINVTGVSSMTLNGGAGNDSLEASSSILSVTLLGGDGNDSLSGSRADDLLDGGEGSDRLVGNLGNDCMYGSGGTDSLAGGAGDDMLFGGAGNDTLIGNVGNDLLSGDVGLDLIDGNDGDDTLFGGGGNDTLRGGAGHDRLAGGLGQDSLLGQDGNDTLVGGSGVDTLGGGFGNDVLAPRTGSGVPEGDSIVAEAGSEDLLILTSYALDSEYDFLTQHLAPFLWLGGDFEAGPPT